MGKVRANNAFGTVQGKIGELVFAHRQDGETLVRKAPVRKKRPTEGELKNQSRFRRGSAYVKALKANPDAYAVYQQVARVRRKRACDLAQSDFLNAPVIQNVDLTQYAGRVGDPIQVEAADTFEVMEVRVRISGASGSALEEGAAERDKASGRWVYTAQSPVAEAQTVLVEVTASDRAGNSVSKVCYQPVSPAG